MRGAEVNMSLGDDKRLTAQERQELVAFLDNEVPEEVAAMLESKIAGSASARREVEELRQTWDLLDFLPMPEAPTDFSHRTVEILTQADAHAGKLGETLTYWALKIGSVAAAIVAIAGSFLLGQFAVSMAPDHNRQIVQDLPVLQNLDEYEAVGDLRFLELLRDYAPLQDVEDPFKTAAEAPETE